MKFIWLLTSMGLMGTGFGEQISLCNSDLLFSYGIKNPRYLNQRGVYCGGDAEETCCDHVDQARVLRHWNAQDRNTVKPYLESSVWLMKAIFNYYEDVLVLAKFMYNDSSFSDSCRASAEALVMNYKTKDQVRQFVAKLEDFYVALGFARKSFYCSLCSLENQKYFVKDSKKVIFSEEFCINMVQLGIDTMYYKTAEVLVDLQHMADVMDCKEKRPQPIVLQLPEKDVRKVTNCYDQFLKLKDPQLWFQECKEVCREFSLSQANDIIDGNVAVLSEFFDTLKNSDLVVTDPIFEDLRMEEKYDFLKLKEQFFENQLGFEDLGKYESVFEPYGVNLFTDARTSLFFYGPHNSLEVIKKFVVLAPLVFSILTFLF